MRPSPSYVLLGLRLSLLRWCAPMVVALAVVGCSSGAEVEQAEPVQATPAPEPLLPAAPATLFHLRVVEGLKAPPGPLWSPMDRHLPAVPTAAELDAEFLRTDEAEAAVVERLDAWLRGEFPSGADLLLVEWKLRWGRGGLAGEGRSWGACVLPCRIDDDFVATAKHHPADPIRDPLVLFAGRPGASDLVVRREADGLLVKHGESTLWAADAPGPVIRKKQQVVGKLRAADGSDGDARRIKSSRSLRVTELHQRTLEPSDATERVRASDALAERAEETVRVLPELLIPGPDDVARYRAIEGQVRYWPWLEANQFEGGFAIRPDPGLEGLTVERQQQRVQWIPTARQAGQGRVDFVTYSLARAGVSAIITPFPGGVEVLSATFGLDQRLLVAALGGQDAIARAQGVVREFERFQSVFPLPDTLGEPPVVIYLSEHPAAVVLSSSEDGTPAFVVSSRDGEGWSLASAWGRMVLGEGGVRRSAEVRDFVAWLRPKLLGGEDRSQWTPVFEAAGEDVLEVWVQGLKGGGETARLSGFLAYVGKKIPALATQLRRDLARSAVLARSLPSITTLAANETETRSLEDKGPTVSAVWAVEVPPSGSLELRVEPSKEADLWGEVAVVSAEAWKSAEGSDAVLAELEPQWSEPLAPSDGDAMALTWGSPKEPREDAQEGSEPGVLLVSLWGAGAWKATAQISHQSPSGAGTTP